jgi:hypothetical protein
MELLSLTPPPLKSDEYIEAFEIQTQGVDIFSVCHVPYGWKARAGIVDKFTGELSGEAGLGASFVSPSSKNMNELNDMFLIRITTFTTRWDGYVPPTFRAKATIGRYGENSKERVVRLNVSNLPRKVADRCPPPRL